MGSLKHGLLLGIPYEDLTQEEAVALISEWLLAKVPKFIGWIDQELVDLVFSWHLAHPLPEVVRTLRDADLILSNFGPHRVDSTCLVGDLFEMVKKHHLKVLCIGSNKLRLQKFQAKYPQGVWTNCFVQPMEGEHLANMPKENITIAETIDQEQPNLILLLLDHPEQEIMIERLRPMSIGGCVMALPSGDVSFNLARELKKHFVSLVEKGVAIYEEHACQEELPISSFRLPFQTLFKVDGKQVQIINIPKVFCGKVLQEFERMFENQEVQDINVFDFKKLAIIDTPGMSVLIKYWTQAIKEKKEVYGVAMSSSLQTKLRWYRVLDVFAPRLLTKNEQLLRRCEALNDALPLHWTAVDSYPYSIIRFFGQMDARQDQTDAYDALIQKFVHAHVIFDFSWCDFIDSSGLGFLLRLRKYLVQIRKPLILVGLDERTLQTLQVAKVTGLFHFEKDIESAVEYSKKNSYTKSNK